MGECIVVSNVGMKVPVALREETVYEGNPVDIKPGACVTVWFRNVAERQLVATELRLLSD